MLDQLVELGYLQARRNFGAAANQAYRYRLGDPALRFYHGLVLPNEPAIDTAGAKAVWRERLAPRTWPTYVGQHVFEEVVEQAYLRHQRHREIPVVEEWGQWQGKDRNRRSLELDAVCRLLDGGVLTGSMKLRAEEADATEPRSVTGLHGTLPEDVSPEARSPSPVAPEPGLPYRVFTVC